MKNLIKKILKEETSDLKPALIRAFYTFMEMEMEGYNIYVDTPKNRFRYTPGSIWIVNPNTKEWFIELKNLGGLWYNYKFYKTFSNLFNQEQSVFEQLITMWVEDVLKRGVSTTPLRDFQVPAAVEDVLKRGVSRTFQEKGEAPNMVKDVIKRGIKIS
jgi:hypothetical protein